MVTASDTTEIITRPKMEECNEPSFKRWLKHFLYMPATKRYFDKQDQQAIAQAVEQAEHGHVGEIQVVIEGHIPANQAYRQNTHARAQQLFAELGVWDTEYNSGVLLYLNLCDRKVEIVTDRGINKAAEQQVWNEICTQLIVKMKQGEYRLAVCGGVFSIGEILDKFYHGVKPDEVNEISNSPIILG